MVSRGGSRLVFPSSMNMNIGSRVFQLGYFLFSNLGALPRMLVFLIFREVAFFSRSFCIFVTDALYPPNFNSLESILFWG